MNKYLYNMKKIVAILIILTLSGCKSMMEKQAISKANINTILDSWHKAAANANYEDYFALMADDAVFIGTDATENWDKKAFQAYAKPHFDKGKAWNFTTLERHIYFDETGKTAWFDELLNTQMKICRGSGVLIKTGKDWKIKQYVLSMTVPNKNSYEVVKVKSALEDAMIQTLKSKQ